MAGGFSPQLLEEIRARVDIVDLVGQFVNLKRAGENWKGLCPFHAEKTPSFMVHPKKGIFHCFGCGVGGDAFGFLMRQDRLQFPEAVRVLAERAGVSLPTERRTEVDGQRDALFKTMTAASEFYQDALWNRPAGEGARRYLDSRGIAPDMARRFGLGYSPETPLYVKGQTLYAFDLAKPQIREKNRALVVEGYVDCLMAHQHGFTETVAALGTAFTPSRLGLPRRYCDEVITFFDADAAGKKATQRVEELLEPGTQGVAWAGNRTGTVGGGAGLRPQVPLPP